MRQEILTLRDVWLSGYQRLLAEARSAGRVEIRGPGQERRTHPRFRVSRENVLLAPLQLLDVLDLSVGGVCLLVTEAVAVDSRLDLSLANAFCTSVEVVGCVRAEDRRFAGAPAYLVRGRFLDEEQGLQFVTLTLELERIEQV